MKKLLCVKEVKNHIESIADIAQEASIKPHR